MGTPRSLRRIAAALCALLVCAIALSGCNWTGKGKEVATAIATTTSVKSGAFNGQMKMNFTAPPAGSGIKSSGPDNVTMTFSGAWDGTDPANPKMTMTMTAEGQSTSMVAPGDGKMYLTSQGKSYVAPIPPDQTSTNNIDPAKIIGALGGAVSHFQSAPSMTNAKGAPVKTITATVSKKELCGSVLDAFGETMNTANPIGSSAGSSERSLGKDGKKMMQTFCQTMLKKDPRVWFGLDNGLLTDVALTGSLTIPFAGKVDLEVQFHQYDLNKPQTGFAPPTNATPLNSLNELPGSSSSGTTSTPGFS
jgi:predicted small secreted protein